MKTFSTLPGDEEREVRLCPLCGSAEQRLLWEMPPSRFVQCRRCRLVYQNPQPLSRELEARYDGAYLAYELENEEAFYRLMRMALDDIAFGQIEDLWRSSGLFLDVGCATGRLLQSLGEQGWRVQGVEVCKPAAVYGRENRDVPIYTGPLETAGWEDESIAVVHSSHVIEHLADPAGFIREAYRLLKPGGYLLITTPNRGGFQARLFQSRWRSVIHDHVVLFSRENLKRMVQEKGFKVEKCATWGGLARGSAPDIVKRVMDRVVKPLGWGDVMILRAHKPG